MSQTGVIIRRKGGTFVPNEMFSLAIENNPTAWGAAIIRDGILDTNQGHGNELEFFQTTMKEFKDDDITFILANNDVATDLSDVGPYPVLSDGNGKDLIVACIEGNFPGLAQEKSTHPAEFFLANSYIAPKLSELYDLCGNDIDKLMTHIEKKSFKDDILRNAVSRGAISLIGANGKAVSFSLGDTAAEFPWGWVSNTYGYGGEKKEAEPEKAKTAFPKRSTVREKANVQPSVPSVPTPAASTAVASAPKNITVAKWKPHEGASRSQKKDQYKARIGYLPKGWVNGIEISVYRDQTGKVLTLAETQKMGLAVAALPKLNNPPPQNDRESKDTETEHIPGQDQPELPGSQQVTDKVLPLMGPKTREYMKDVIRREDIQKMIAENADIVSDPAVVQAMEKKFAGFASQLGMKEGTITDFMVLPYEVKLDLIKKCPEGMAVFTHSVCNILASRMAKDTRKEPVKAEAEEVQPKAKVAFPKRNAA